MDKKAISEIVAYVLLIVIALSLASGVYVWLRAYVPPEEEKEKCPEDVALSIIDYSCTQGNEITIVLENKGLFNINGFFIRASNDSRNLPTVMLNRTDVQQSEIIPGRYDFKEPLKLGYAEAVNFSYTGLNKIARIQIQPFVTGKKELLLCDNVADITIEGC